MPKGKGQRDYDREIEEAIERMKKYKEHLASARTNDTWQEFLMNIGVNPDAVTSSAGSNFWDKVRTRINQEARVEKARDSALEREADELVRLIARRELELRVEVRVVKGREVIQVRDEKGRFTSRKGI